MKATMKVAVFTAVFLGTGCSHADNNLKSPNSMSEMKNAKSWCAGRYTIKLPSTAKIMTSYDDFNSFTIKSRTGTSIKDFNDAFNYQLNRYTKSSVSAVLMDSGDRKVGSKTYRILAVRAGTIKNAPLQLFAFVFDRNVLFSIELPYKADKKDIVFDELNYLIAGLSSRNSNTIPSQKGVCIANGFIKDDGTKFRRSSHSFSVMYSDMPSLKTNLQVEAISEKVPDLLTRIKGNLQSDGVYTQTMAAFKTIRKGQKNQDQGDKLSGLEWVSEAPMKGQSGIIANWEHTGTLNNSLDPDVLFNFDSAFNGSTSSLNEKQSINLYETILNTIKKF